MPNEKHIAKALNLLHKGGGIIAARLDAGPNYNSSTIKGISPTLVTGNGGIIYALYKEEGMESKCEMAGMIGDNGYEKTRRVYSPEGVCPAMMSYRAEDHNPRILDRTLCLNSKVNGAQPSLQDRIYASEGISPACTTIEGYQPNIKENNDMIRIRKLTPGECMRLMGFQQEDTQAMRDAGFPDSAIYHCAGDSICVNVLMLIFGAMVPDCDHVETTEAYMDLLSEEE